MQKAGRSFKAKSKGCCFTSCVERVVAHSLLQNVKIYPTQKNRKIQGKEFMQKLGLAQKVLESQVTGGWENIVLKYYCILALPIQFCLCICQCSFLPLPSPVPRGTTLVGPS